MDFNELDPIGTEPGERKLFRNTRFRRGVYILPSFLTVANLLCGYYAILAALEGTTTQFDNAARAIGIAILFDSLDGRIARAMGTTSDFGKEFDSLADVVSFGVAPAILAYAWGVKTLAYAEVSEGIRLIQLGWLIGFVFLGCCAWRLARFNIHGMAAGSNRYFVGMPTPAGAGMIAAVIHARPSAIEDVHFSILWLVLIVTLGVLMSSTIRYSSFKDIQWARRRSSLAVVLLVAAVGAVVLYSQVTLLILASVYVAHGIVIHLARTLRHRVASRPA